jgi:hypothetical protein
VSPDHHISSMAIGQVDTMEGKLDKILIGNEHGIARRVDIESFLPDREYYKIGAKNSRISKIIWGREFLWFCDGDGSIKKFYTDETEHKDSYMHPIKLRGICTEPIRSAGLSPDEKFFITSGKTRMNLIATDYDAS